MPSTAEMPWPARIRLAHAALQAVAYRANADALLIKGYATDPRLYFPGRASTDVDLLVRPAHVPQMIKELEALGWRTVTTFRSGSIFHHAQTMQHPAWGLVDIHRSFPGFDTSPQATFHALWQTRTTLTIAGYPCHVPALLDQALVIVVHSARNTLTIRQDVAHLRSVLGPEDWRALRSRAEQLDASLAFAAATGQLHQYEDHPSHDLWAVLSRGGTRSQEWRARMRAATTLREKTLVALSAPLPNIDHLRMDLEREPSRLEIVRAAVYRPWKAVGELLTGRAKRGPGPPARAELPPAGTSPAAQHSLNPETARLERDPVLDTPGEFTGLLSAHRQSHDCSTTRSADDVAPPQSPVPSDTPAPAPPVTSVSASPAPAPSHTPGPVSPTPASSDAPAPGSRTSAPSRPSSRDRDRTRVLRLAPDVAVVDDIDETEDRDLYSPVYVARVPHQRPRIMDGTAALIWRVALGSPPDSVAVQVAQLLGLPPETIESDVRDFLDQLQKDHLLV